MGAAAAPDVAAFVIQWVESRAFLADYLDSLPPDVAAAIQPMSSNGGLFPFHLLSPIATNKPDDQVGLG